MGERYYFGDWRLYGTPDDHFDQPERGAVLEFEGSDQDHALVIPANPNWRETVVVRLLVTPNASDRSYKGLKALVRTQRAALIVRSSRADPFVWVQDDARSKAVGGYAAPVVTSNAHGFSNGDVLLVRRAGAGLWSLVTASAVAANTFNVAAVPGTTLHAIAAADEIHLVEEYRLGCVLASHPDVERQEEPTFREGFELGFRASGRYTYARASVPGTLGS